MHKTEELKFSKKKMLMRGFDPSLTPKQRKEARELVPNIESELEETNREKRIAFQGEPPQASPPKPRYPKSSKPQKSSSLKRQIVMDNELSGGRPTRRRRARRVTRKRKGFVKRSNK